MPLTKEQRLEKESRENLRKLELDRQYAARLEAREERARQMKIRKKKELCQSCRLRLYATTHLPKCNHTASFIPPCATKIAYDYNNKPYVISCSNYTPHKCDGCENMLTCPYTKAEGIKNPETFSFIKGFVRLMSPNGFIAITNCAHYEPPKPRKPFRSSFACAVVGSLYEQIIDDQKKGFIKSPTYSPKNDD